MNEKDIWKIVLENMQKNNGFSNLTIDLWFSRMSMEKLTPERAYFSTDNDLIKNIIESKYAAFMRDELKAVLGFDVEPVIISCEKRPFDEQLAAIENEEESDRIKMVEKMLDNEDEAISKEEQSKSFRPARTVSSPQIIVSPSLPEYSPEYTFDNFVVGSSNKHAYHMARSVAANPAKIANPLFIHGSPGLGKTHLLYAITKEMSDKHADFKIIYTKGEDFTNELIESLANKTPIQFREKYRNADALLMDDIQFIAGKESIQEEFFHTYEALFEAGKQIIVTSDRLPKDIKTLAERLRSRFEHDVIVDIKPPDLELRVAIFKKKSQNLGMNVPNDVLMYLGENIKDNIRQIEGILNQIKAYISLHKTNPTISVIQGYIKNISSEMKVDPVTTDRVILEVARYFSIEENDIRSRKRNANLVWARHVSIYIISKVTGISNSQISKDLKMDHTSVSHALKNVEKQMSIDPYKKRSIEELIDNLNKLR